MGLAILYTVRFFKLTVFEMAEGGRERGKGGEGTRKMK